MNNDFLIKLCQIVAGEQGANDNNFMTTIDGQVMIVPEEQRDNFKQMLVLAYVAGCVKGMEKAIDDLTDIVAGLRDLTSQDGTIDLSDSDIVRIVHEEALEAVPYEQ